MVEFEILQMSVSGELQMLILNYHFKFQQFLSFFERRNFLGDKNSKL